VAASELRSRLFTLLLMAAGAVALLLYARREDALSQPRVPTGLLYPGLDVGAVTRLYISLRAGQDLQFERDPGSAWRIVEPAPEYGRQELVAVILDNLARAQVEAVEPADGQPLSAENVGLDPPRHIIRFGDANREETLLLGEVEPLGRMVYARRHGHARIVLVTRNLVTLLQGHAADFVDSTLLRGLAGPVDMLRVTGPEGVRLHARRSGEHWTLELPEPVLGDDGKLSTLVRALAFVRHTDALITRPTATQLRQLGLPDDADIARGELRGATLVELGAPGEQPVRAWLQAGWEQQAGESVAARRGTASKVVGVPRLSLSMLTNDADSFRKRQLLPPIAERAEALRLERDGRVTLAIRRGKDGRWLFEQPERLAGEVVEATRVAGHSVLGDFLARLDALTATGFCDPPAGEPVARLGIEWTRAGTTTTDRVDCFPPTEAGVPCTTSERPGEGLLVPADVLELFLPLQADRLRSTRPISFDDARWARLVIDGADGASWTLEREAPSGAWSGDDEWARRIALGLDVLRGLRGLRWEAERAGVGHRWRVRYEDADGGVLAELLLRPSQPDEDLEVLGVPVVRARVAGRPGVELVVAREWVERIDALASPPERMAGQ
jgi:hypothetical protein